MTSKMSSLQCPRCRVALHVGEARNLTLHACAGCGGLWLDNDGSRRMVEQFEADALELADRVERNVTREVDASSAELPCPVCQGVLERKRVGAVDVDICKAHGTWFDRGEVQRVARAMAELRRKKFKSSGERAANARRAQQAFSNYDLEEEVATWTSTEPNSELLVPIAFALVEALLASGGDGDYDS